SASTTGSEVRIVASSLVVVGDHHSLDEQRGRRDRVVTAASLSDRWVRQAGWACRTGQSLDETVELRRGDLRVRVVVAADGQVLALGPGHRPDDDDKCYGSDAVAERAALAGTDGQGDDGRGDEDRDEVHHLEQRVDGRAGGVLEGVTDGVTDDGSGVCLRALATVVTVLDDLLRVVP